MKNLIKFFIISISSILIFPNCWSEETHLPSLTVYTVCGVKRFVKAIDSKGNVVTWNSEKDESDQTFNQLEDIMTEMNDKHIMNGHVEVEKFGGHCA